MVPKWKGNDINIFSKYKKSVTFLYLLKNAVAIFDKLNIKFDIYFPEGYKFGSPKTTWGKFADKRSKESMIKMINILIGV